MSNVLHLPTRPIQSNLKKFNTIDEARFHTEIAPYQFDSGRVATRLAHLFPVKLDLTETELIARAESCVAHAALSLTGEKHDADAVLAHLIDILSYRLPVKRYVLDVVATNDTTYAHALIELAEYLLGGTAGENINERPDGHIDLLAHEGPDESVRLYTGHLSTTHDTTETITCNGWEPEDL